MSLQAIKFEDNKLYILDQLKLPHESVYIEIRNTEDAHAAIRSMQVRGAPAIAIVGMLGVAVDLLNAETANGKEYALGKLEYVVTARPTAVNLGNAVREMKNLVAQSTDAQVREDFLVAAEAMLAADIEDNMAIGEEGVKWITDQKLGPCAALTICNTGSLATAGYGTALGIIRSLHNHNLLSRVYALETRPYNQGARLTAYELVHDRIPATLITDSMAAALMKLSQGEIKVAIVGADRVAANGDVANKVGTYQLAVLARFHGVKFIVAAPTTSIDLNTASGDAIKIEQRPGVELTHVNGQQIAASGIDVWNPSFDVTPYSLIDAIITENGVFIPGKSAV